MRIFSCAVTVCVAGVMMIGLPGTSSLQISAASAQASVQPIEFQRETLPNGLRVIYAPMENAPVVHVRVLYHVGARDERPDRQGFAHMFEHMMFRGSQHVASEQHMKLINSVGGISNAFTSFDQTTYINTVPTNHLEMALWLEADRLASFKVSKPVLETEREVVKEEWRLRYANQPYGTMFQDLFALAFTTHNYRWMPIGDMDQLAQSQPQELQDFHDTFYVPNNACLIIAGQFDVEAARTWVRDYYGWIPAGPAIERSTRPEPEQTEERTKIVYRPQVPVTRISLAYKSPDYRHDDHLALEVLTSILGSGRSSRLYMSLVGGDAPIAAGASMGNYQLQDPSLVVGSIAMLPGKDPDEALARFTAEIDRVIKEGVTPEELNKARTLLKVQLIQQRQTAESVASVLGEEEVFGGDATRANQVFERLERLTPADIQKVAERYLKTSTRTVVQYRPGNPPEAAPGTPAAPAQSSVPADESRAKPVAFLESPPASSTETTVVSQRNNVFPDTYPKAPPMSDEVISRPFNKGVVSDVRGVQVITLSDDRLPVVSMSLVMRGGGHSIPPEKTGLASMVAQLLSRGAGGMTAQQIADDLEGRGISIGVSDDGDITRASAFAITEQLDHAVDRFITILRSPDFPENEFMRLRQQAMAGLMQELSNPGSVADRKLDEIVYGPHPYANSTSLASIQTITPNDVRGYYQSIYSPKDAILIFSGAITQERANQLAEKILDGWETTARPVVDYRLPETPSNRRIILVENPRGQQAAIRMGVLAYDLANEDRFAGSVAGQILSSGIDSRLNRVLRAEKGLTYGSYGYFRPARKGGAFELNIDTKPESVKEAVESAFEVLETMRRDPVTSEELSIAKRRVAGMMVLETQTVQQQAGRRLDTILNDYPIDYYDNYASLIAQVEASQVREVMERYVTPDRMTIVVVAPPETADQLAAFGEVVRVQMPLAAQMPQP